MSAPVFLSSRWKYGGPRLEVDELDRHLRLCGVPVWRDVRELGAGGVNEDEVWRAITETCCGLVLYFSDDVPLSWFINSVELRAVRQRRDRDQSFFVTALFDGVDRSAIERLRQETGLDVRAFQGLVLESGRPVGEQLQRFAAQVLDRYLASQEPPFRARVATRDEISFEEEAHVHLNWDGLLGDDETPLDPAGPAELKGAARVLRESLERRSGERELTLTGTAHLSAAFLLGWEFRETTGWKLDCEHPRVPVRTEIVAADAQGWNVTVSPSQNDSDLLVARIGISQDPDEAVRAHRAGEAAARAELVLTPPPGTIRKVSLDGVDLASLGSAVIAAIQAARDQYGVRRTDLYLACPWTFATQLGWMFASLGQLRVLEATPDKTTYYDEALVLP